MQRKFALLATALLAAGLNAAEPAIQKHQTGVYNITTEGMPEKIYYQTLADYGAKPRADLVTTVHRGGQDWVVENDVQGAVYRVVAPSNYTPDMPHGVLVFINAFDSGVLPIMYHALLSRYHLIAIGADQSGNDHDTAMRHSYAIVGVELLRERYNIDSDRIYVTGLSGGGRMTSHVMIINADLFTGGIPLIGCNSYKSVHLDGNSYIRGFWPRPNLKTINQARLHGRYALMTGSKDFNQPGTQQVYTTYKQAGFRHIIYLEEPELGHAPPSAEWFEKALNFLDEPLRVEAEKAWQKVANLESAGRLGQALEACTKAATHGGDADFVSEATAKMKALHQQYNQVKADLGKTFADNPARGVRALEMFRRDWNPVNKDDLESLTEQLHKARLRAQ